MNVSFKLSDPEDLNCTVTFSATLREIKEMMAQFPQREYPTAHLYYALHEAVTNAEKTFYGRSKEDE